MIYKQGGKFKWSRKTVSRGHLLIQIKILSKCEGKIFPKTAS